MPNTSPIFEEYISNMANPTNLPPSVIAQIKEVAANIPPKHHDIPKDGGTVLSIESAILYLNN